MARRNFYGPGWNTGCQRQTLSPCNQETGQPGQSKPGGQYILMPGVRKIVIVFLLFASSQSLLFQQSVWAAIDPMVFKNVAEEARYKNLIDQLRCLVCQNQTIADSNAELAQDLRREVYGMIKSGKTDKEITDFLVARYSDFVLYRPPVNAATFLLWFLPGLLAVFALVFVVFFIKRRNSENQVQALGENEESRVDKLVGPK
jgi:cytochrome c-type biogenesis protein CcmH